MTTRHRHTPSHRLHQSVMHEPHRDTPYQANDKRQELSQCIDCGLIYQHSRWQQLNEVIHGVPALTCCPACARIRNRAPAGLLQISGTFFAKHKDEILNLIFNQEQIEKEAHPLDRIISVEKNSNGVIISYTGEHLTQSTGQALRHSYQGCLDIESSYRDGPVRVYWYRY